MAQVACESKLRLVFRSSMNPCPENWVAIGRVFVYYAKAARTFSAGIKCQHCTIISHVKIESLNWLTGVQHASAVVLTRQCQTPAAHILRLIMKSFLSLLVTPSGENASYQSHVTLTSSKTEKALFPRIVTGSGLLWSARTLVFHHCRVCSV